MYKMSERRSSQEESHLIIMAVLTGKSIVVYVSHRVYRTLSLHLGGQAKSGRTAWRAPVKRRVI